MRLLSAILAAVLLAIAPAHAEKRVALVIGNKDYKASVGPLTNPLNDIRLVSDALRSVGFEVLKPVQNATRSEMLQAIYAFASTLKNAGPDAVGFLYYSGHGAASQGENYLIPIDVTEPSTEQLRIQGVRQSEVLEILRTEAPNAAHYLVLDACRNNLQGARGGKGFVAVGQQNGVLVAFSTEPGKTAQDTGSGSGPYAAALATELAKPGQNDLLMFHRIRVDVIAKTNGDQVPWTEDGIQRPERPVFASAPPVADRSPPNPSEAERAWELTQGTISQFVLEDFIKRYGDSFYGTLARARLEELKKSQVAVVAPTTAPNTPASGACGGPVVVSVAFRPAQPLSAVEECSLKPKDVFRECEKCPGMMVVPSGNFAMGSPSFEPERFDGEAQVAVTIAKTFAVGQFPVTFDEWDQCVADGGCDGYKPDDNDWGRGRRPVINVSWDDAQKYVAWISGKTGKTYRLLSDAEREYVTRAGTTTPFWWGSSIAPSDANYNGSAKPYRGGGSKGEYRKKTMPVDSFLPNPWGLYDVHGNMSQWTQDCWNESNVGNPGDGSARMTGDCGRRVLRGGSWFFDPRNIRAASRDSSSTDYRYDSISFRVARTLSP
jgi:formylglycine-generating enzyme required for sulfatase activity